MNTLLKQCTAYCKDLKILYVEDHLELRNNTVETLKHFFNEITVAEDGQKGLQKYQESTFDLVMTDINMPNMNGLEMIQEIKKQDNQIVTLILSAHNETEYLISSIKLGIDGFLLKPLELTQLVDTLCRVVETIHLKKEVKIYQSELVSSNLNLERKVEGRTVELKHRLYHDQLTELKNYQALIEEIGHWKYETLFLIDIDGFQKFNDFYGLNAGNTILKKFAKLLREFNSDEKYSLYRVYGDVFAMYNFSNTIKEIMLKKDIEKFLGVLKTFKVYIVEIDEEVEVEASIGICANESSPFVKADMALKVAKKESKSIVIYTEEIDSYKKLAKDMYWKKEIKKAIKNDNILPVFQAIVDKKGKVVKYETLMRLRQYEKKKEHLISPYAFLESAVKTRQYDTLTRIIVEKSFSIMSKENVDFSINLSFEDFSDSARVEFLHEEIVKHGIGKRLIIEILESEVVSDYNIVINVLEGLKKYGIRVAIDDFGTGFSNFEHILKLNPDYIKIDASMIRNILTDEKSFTLVKAIAEFSKELGIKVIAEFVSSKEIFDTLKELPIDEYQGYYFSIPSKTLKVVQNV